MINYVSKMKALIFLVCVLFLATNCTNEDPVEEVEMDDVCGVADPVNSLKWPNEEFKQFLGGLRLTVLFCILIKTRTSLRCKIHFLTPRIYINITVTERS
jgi:hypothetical protein